MLTKFLRSPGIEEIPLRLRYSSIFVSWTPSTLTDRHCCLNSDKYNSIINWIITPLNKYHD